MVSYFLPKRLRICIMPRFRVLFLFLGLTLFPFSAHASTQCITEGFEAGEVSSSKAWCQVGAAFVWTRSTLSDSLLTVGSDEGNPLITLSQTDLAPGTYRLIFDDIFEVLVEIKINNDDQLTIETLDGSNLVEQFITRNWVRLTTPQSLENLDFFSLIGFKDAYQNMKIPPAGVEKEA